MIGSLVEFMIGSLVETSMSLLQTVQCDSPSHSCSSLSQPAVANCGSEGCGASPHSSSTWPSTAGERPSCRSPCRIQLRVVPTNSPAPRPSATTRTPP